MLKIFVNYLMIKRVGSKPERNITPPLSEEEIKKILGENDPKKNKISQIDDENRIPDRKIIQEKYQQAKKSKCLIKLISHRNLINKIESIRQL